MRSVLIGAVESSLITYRALKQYGYPPSLILTLAQDLGARRHSDYVDLSAHAGSETDVAFVENCNAPEHIDRVAKLRPDILFVIGWSQLVGQELRAAARQGVVGFHPALLPMNRGRAALAWTILLGLKETGVSLFKIDEGTDSGDILSQQRFAVDPRETVATLMTKCNGALEAALFEALPPIIAGTLRGVEQRHELATYLAARTEEDGLIDWTLPRLQIDRLIRAVTRPYPGAFTFTKSHKVTIWAAEPVELANYTHAAPGQVITRRDGCPIVRCGDDKDLILKDIEIAGEPGRRLPAGQIRLRPSMGTGH